MLENLSTDDCLKSFNKTEIRAKDEELQQSPSFGTQMEPCF